MRLVFVDSSSLRNRDAHLAAGPMGWRAVTPGGDLVVQAPTQGYVRQACARLGLRPKPGHANAVRRIVVAATDFQRRVWQACRQIPAGQTMTYGELARKLGCGSAQAVGQAIGQNHLAQVIPCHRVVASRGLGGFAWGLARKRRWLRDECAWD